MRLAQAEVYEVATFYAHFDVVKEGEAPPPPLTVRICDGICCELAGSRALHAALASAVGSGVRVLRAPCIGACDHAPAAMVGRRRIGPASAEAIGSAIEAAATVPEQPPFPTSRLTFRPEATRFSGPCRTQQWRRPTLSKRCTTRACAGWAGPASQRRASGA